MLELAHGMRFTRFLPGMQQGGVFFMRIVFAKYSVAENTGLSSLLCQKRQWNGLPKMYPAGFLFGRCDFRG